MRPGQNKRMRGRNSNNNNNRKGPNPLTRSYESNGPDVKIRGTAHHIGEKYLQLARDAQSSGDPVMAESYLQHAEHYFRLIASAQQAQQQAQFGYQRQPGEQIEQEDEGDDDDFGGMPDRFASPSERVPSPPPAVAQQAFPDRQSQGDRPPQGAERPDRSNGGAPYQYAERQGGERQAFDRQDRAFDNRGGRNGYQERNGQDRPYQDRNGQERNGQDRGTQDRGGQDRNQPYRGDVDRAGQDRAYRDDRQPRDYDNRNFRNRNRDDRPSRDQREPNQPRDGREPRQPAEEQPDVGLPAFITAPVRALQESTAGEAPALLDGPPTTPDPTDDAGFHMRPRRRRRSKADFAPLEGEDTGHESPATDPIEE